MTDAAKETTDRCPKCGADLRGETIPEDQREAYGGATHVIRKIGIVAYDRIVAWRCPDCGSEWPRNP